MWKISVTSYDILEKHHSGDSKRESSAFMSFWLPKGLSGHLLFPKKKSQKTFSSETKFLTAIVLRIPG